MIDWINWMRIQFVRFSNWARCHSAALCMQCMETNRLKWATAIFAVYRSFGEPCEPLSVFAHKYIANVCQRYVNTNLYERARTQSRAVNHNIVNTLNTCICTRTRIRTHTSPNQAVNFTPKCPHDRFLSERSLVHFVAHSHKLNAISCIVMYTI